MLHSVVTMHVLVRCFMNQVSLWVTKGYNPSHPAFLISRTPVPYIVYFSKSGLYCHTLPITSSCISDCFEPIVLSHSFVCVPGVSGQWQFAK